MNLGKSFLEGNFMDYIDKPMMEQRPMKKGKRTEQMQSDYGYDDIGLDFGNALNLGISGWGTNNEIWKGGIDHSGWGFENYIAHDFQPPKAFIVYGKKLKADKKYRTVGPENEVLFGLESLGIAGSRAYDNSAKVGKIINKRIYEAKIRKAKKQMDKQRTKKYYKDDMGYESEPKQEKDDSAEAFYGKQDDEEYQYEEERPRYEGQRTIRPDYDEYGSYQEPDSSGQIVVPRKPKRGRKYTKYLGKKSGRHYFASDVYRGYFPE